MKILANDGISPSGVNALQASGFEIETTNVAQEQLVNYINENNIKRPVFKQSQIRQLIGHISEKTKKGPIDNGIP